MICPECGSYQPDRAKYCGICGGPLSQEGLVEHFLKEESEQEIEIPRHRSAWFYLVFVLVVILSLAVMAGIGYIVYRAAWGEEETGVEDGAGAKEKMLDYIDTDLGFIVSYPKRWTLEDNYPMEGELASLQLCLSMEKTLELYAFQLDPVVTIGGLEGIEEYIEEDALERTRSLGGDVGEDGQPGDGGEEPPGEMSEGEGTAGEGEAAGGEEKLFISTTINDMPAFYTEFRTNYMGEETEFLLFYVIADDVLFVFQGRAPASEYQEVRPQLIAIISSFVWESPEEPTAPGMPEISAKQCGTCDNL